MTQLMSAVESAQLLGIDRSTFLEHVRNGRIVAAAKAPGIRGAYLFDRDDVERLKAERDERPRRKTRAAS